MNSVTVTSYVPAIDSSGKLKTLHITYTYKITLEVLAEDSANVIVEAVEIR